MRRSKLSAKSILTALLCLLVLWAPLPFGSITPAAKVAIQLGAFMSLALAGFSLRSTKVVKAVTPIALPMVALGVLAVSTSFPWPRWLVQLVSPAHLRLADEASRALGREVPAWVAPSLAPELSRHTGVSWMAAAALVVSAAIVAHRRQRLRWLVGALLGSAAVQGLLGLRARLGGVATVWGRAETNDPGYMRGTFVNQNNAAFFFMIAAALALGVVWWGFRRAEREASVEIRVLLRTLPTVLWLALLAALTLTGSRAGLVAALAASAAQFGAIAWRRKRWWLLPAGVGAALSTLVLGALMSGSSGIERVAGTSLSDVTESYRFEAWRACLELWRQFPVLGTGSGSFREAFPMVQPRALVRETWYHAHNDLLELLATGGILAFAVLAVALGTGAARLVQLNRDARRTDDRAYAIGAAGVLTGSIVHEIFDFSLTIPANWVALSLVLGGAMGVWVRLGLRRRVGSAREAANGRGEETTRVGAGPQTGRR